MTIDELIAELQLRREVAGGDAQVVCEAHMDTFYIHEACIRGGGASVPYVALDCTEADEGEPTLQKSLEELVAELLASTGLKLDIEALQRRIREKNSQRTWQSDLHEDR